MITRILLLAILVLTPALFAEDAQKVKGKLESIDGITVLLVAGSDEEQGFAEGFLCASTIKELFTGFAFKNAFVPSAKMWDEVVVPKVKKRVDVPPYVRARARGIIAGMKAKDPKSLRLEELDRDLNVDDIVAASALPDYIGLMCSSFTVWHGAEEKKPESTWIGRNLDYFGTESVTRNLMLIVRAGSDERRSVLYLGYPGLVGCVTGFSDQGVFVAIHDVAAFGRVGERLTPRLVALDEVLRQTRTDGKDVDVAGAVEKHLKQYQYGMAGNCMLAWRGGGAVLEFDGQRKGDPVTLRRAGSNRFIVCTNHFRKRFESRAGCWRYKCIWDGLLKSLPTDSKSAWELIRSASKEDTLYRIVSNLETGESGLERRKKPLGDEWYPQVQFNFWKLFDKARLLDKKDTEK